MKTFVRWLLSLVVVLSIFLIIVDWGVLTADTVQVNGTFEWTATGDDGFVGTASQYALMYSLDSTSLITDWDNCISIPGLPSPQIAGSAEVFPVSMDLENGTTYFFAIKAADEVPNWSLVSNIVSVFVADDDVPLKINDLKFIRS